MKKILLVFARIICRFVAVVLGQLVWLMPLWGLCWYAKLNLPNFIYTHFGIDQTQDRLASLESFAEVMRQNTSLTNPTTLLNYIGVQLSKISVALKLNTLAATGHIMEVLGVGLINLVWILALLYAVIRIVRVYREKSHEYALAQQITKQLRPDILDLQCEVAALREEVRALRENAALTSEEKLSLPHE